MSADNTQDETPPEGGSSGKSGGEPRKENPDNKYEALNTKYHRTEANSARGLVAITLFASLIGLGTLIAIFLQTQATERAADAAATAANIAANTLTQTIAQATAESTEFAEQRRLSNKQLSKLDDSIRAANRQADASNRQAILAGQSLKESQQTLSVSQANFTAQQRPYLWVQVPEFDAYDNMDMFTASIVVGNYGRGAAQNIRMAFNVWHNVSGGASNEADAFFAQRDKYWTWTPLAALPPGVNIAPSTASVGRYGPYSRNVFAGTWGARDGLAIYGRVRYPDYRKHPFYTDFCIFNVGGQRGAPTEYCTRHNYIE